MTERTRSTTGAPVLVFPDQLFEDHPALVSSDARRVYLVEDRAYFFDHAYHAHKLVLHRAAMSAYASRLEGLGHVAIYLSASDGSHLRLWALLAAEGARSLEMADPANPQLMKRLRREARRAGITIRLLDSPLLLAPTGFLAETLPEGVTRRSMATFYAAQRRRMGVLLDEGGAPLGGRWSFDAENQRRLPRGHTPPTVWKPSPNEHVRRAARSIADELGVRPGVESLEGIAATGRFAWPVTHADARRAVDDFIANRLRFFGRYEDAMSGQYRVLYHSMLSVPLNCGLVTPEYVIDRVLDVGGRDPDVSLTSLEGFVRQVIGWRAFAGGVYLADGEHLRASNEFGHTRPMPASFYAGNTGLEPFDAVVERVLGHGWCHHIERLMVLGNLMLLCEVDPRAVFRWFMDLFVDAYDWVMVPNVYGMSQFAAGPLMTTKPYVSGSSYLLKMGDWPRGQWCEVWDGLYWRFVDRKRASLSLNPRTSVMVRQLEKLDRPKLRRTVGAAEEFLASLG